METLAKCSTCDGAVSPRAVACIHCGEPMPKKLGFGATLLGGLFIVYAVFSTLFVIFAVLIGLAHSLDTLLLWLISVFLGFKVFVRR